MKHGTEKSEPDYGISRIDDDKNRAHAWRVSFRRRGRGHVKNFTDKKYGGREPALQGAREYRDQFIRDNPPVSRKEVCTIRRSNNKSGVTGVCTYPKRYQLSNGSIRENWYWEASWPTVCGESAKALFSVNTYGQDMARQMAFNARREGLATVKGVFWRSAPGDIADRRKDKESSASPSSRVA
jgi:hypothetical protein